jgi:hypothetical protein
MIPVADRIYDDHVRELELETKPSNPEKRR